MTPKLACADFTFSLLAHDHALQLIAMMGLDGVDIGLFEERSHLWPSREFADLRGSARRLKRKLDDLGLGLADLFLQAALDFRPYAINHPEAARRGKTRDWFLNALDYAAACDSKHVTILPGVEFEGEPRADSLARSAEELAWRVERAGAHGIVLGTEAHLGSIAPTPHAAQELLGEVPGLTLTLDYSHFTYQGYPDSAIEPLVKHASHFHIRGARQGRLQEGFSGNAIDFRRIYQVAQESGYGGWFGLEYVWQEWEHCNECDTISETVRFRDFFRALAN